MTREGNCGGARPYFKPMAGSTTHSLRYFYLILGVVVVGALFGILWDSAKVVPTESNSVEPAAEDHTSHSPPIAAELEQTTSNLRGDGPLVVELNWLGNKTGQLASVKRGGFMQGKVLGEGGIPIPFSTIEIWSGPQQGLQVECDQDGAYRFDGLLPGVHLFRVTAGSLQAGRSQRVLARGRTRRNFIVGGPTSLTLKLIGHENKAIEKAKVSGDLGIVYGVSDADGLVELHSLPRSPRVIIDINADGYAATRHELNLMPHNPGVPVSLGPLPRGGKLRGEVKSWPGGPLPQISIAPRALRPASWSYQWELWHNLPTDASGRFELTDLPSGLTVDVRAEHATGISKPVVRAVSPGAYSPASASFVIQARRQSLGGVVRDSSGNLLPGVTVRLEAQDPLAVLGAIYPGLKNRAPAVQLPTPASLRREYKTGRSGKFEFSWADHPKGSGGLLLSARKEGFFPAVNLVKNARSDFALVMDPIVADGDLTLEFLGEIPDVEWWLNNQRQDNSEVTIKNLPQGFYSVEISRSDLLLFGESNFKLQQGTRLELR